MTYSVIYEPGEKTHRDENFPVASYIIRKKHRGAVLAFYKFARAADDVADHPGLSEKEKIILLDQFEATLLGASDAVPAALPLREVIAQRNLSPRHGLDLLIAFRQDARKARYKNWDELMQYCSFSAAPVGRFFLDIHSEATTTWQASDMLCSALQIINHLQDCKADYIRLNRVYIPEDSLASYGVSVSELAEAKASPALRECLAELTKHTQALLAKQALSVQIKDKRLRLEVLTIESIAHKLLEILIVRDPLSERVHLNTLQFIFIVMQAALATIPVRIFDHKHREKL